MPKLCYLLSVVGILSLLGFFAPAVQAENFFNIEKVNTDLSEGYHFISPNKEVTLDISADQIVPETLVKIIHLADKDLIGNFFVYDEKMQANTDLYYLKFSQNNNPINMTFKISLQYQAGDRIKEPYYFDWMDMQFKRLEAFNDTIKHIITFDVKNRSNLIFALFDESELYGRASWYNHPKYKNELMAASRDFAKGSKVKVINLTNNKEVVVTIKDYGPMRCIDWTEDEQRLMGPCVERILDLSKPAFLALATSTGQGILNNIKVVPLE